MSSSAVSTRPLEPYGWDASLTDAFAPYGDEGLIPGRIVRVDRGACDVLTADGPVRAETALGPEPDPTKLPTAGDWAALTTGPKPEIRALLPRRTAFVRSASSKQSVGQVLAANVDHAVIAVSLATDLNAARLERLLSLAWASGAQPLLVLTKCDLIEDPAVLAHYLEDARSTAPGVEVLAVSSATGEGLDVLRAILADGTSVLLGQSGAGKSTLANTLLGEEAQEVRAARDSDGKGRHTTTTRDLLPLPGGGVLIDTPGLRGVGLWEAESGLAQVFAEIEEFASRCRFDDCTHDVEPGCAVLAALESGELSERRLDSYRKLQRENAHIAARTDARLRAEKRRVWRIRAGEGRAARRLKGMDH
ncbi:putative ribosome biogenesis GTPase RsgA [Streptomyces sp. RB5]|uniref:Small ribosomal subunit biogenesis GTPase RsgA n=1 Tax=Streptomyces smaragdinus TaxID=2585196 RepID=A0A7K0CUZ8_9ACTN|nr:ribosome small subunit-dependent GTPase A [Streptomyces smaragdinus]MQY16802.1 putative ribosome biogenesis GTPase RsgA [Streptomyces smaragdinus]